MDVPSLPIALFPFFLGLRYGDGDRLPRGDLHELVGRARLERDAHDGVRAGGGGKSLDLSGRIDDDLVADGDRARRLRADDAGERVEDGDVRGGRAALHDDSEGVGAAGELQAAVVFRDVAFLAREVRAGLVGHADECCFVGDCHVFFSFPCGLGN